MENPTFEVGDVLCAEYTDLSGNPQKVSGECVAVEINKQLMQHEYHIRPKGFGVLIMKFPEKGSWQTSSFAVYRDMVQQKDNIHPRPDGGSVTQNIPIITKQGKKK